MVSEQKLKRQIWTFTELRAHGGIYQTLSPREREVAALLVAGNTSKMIAGKVGLSPRTVEFYRRGLTQKLSATSFSDLIAKLINDLTESTVAVNSDIGRA
jgi:FixJ family two-component response regulator